MKFHHIGLVVKEIRKSKNYFLNLLNMIESSEVIYDPIQKVNLQFLVDQSGIRYELIEPILEDSPSAKWLKRGNSMHHVCYEVEAIYQKIDQFVTAGSLLITGPVPAIAFNNRMIAFLLTPEKFIIELLEKE